MSSPPVTITEVIHAPNIELSVQSLYLDAPRVGEGDTYAIEFSGWVMSHRLKPLKLVLQGPGVLPRDIRLGLPRPDLVEHFPDIVWAASHSGFRTQSRRLELPDAVCG